MAADTAYLQGGPCDGQTKKITSAESDSGTIACRGGEYLNDNGRQRPNGDIIFKYAGPAPKPGGPPPHVKAARAHHGWADLQGSVNRRWHPALNRSERLTRAALRSLARAHRVKR